MSPNLLDKAAVGLKRVMDVTVASCALVALSPLLLGIAGLIRVVDGPPVLFRQQRPGLHGRLFTILKFRTMRVGPHRSEPGEVTRLGAVLRRWSLDELPQLVNVVAGTMSLVGPRPLLPEFLAYYNREESRRHAVRPGLTGWAQVNGRNAVDWDQRLALDLWYVDHRSLRLDLAIIARSIPIVLGGRNSPGQDDLFPPGFAADQAAEVRDTPPPASS